MKVKLASIMVDDQDKALKFYTEVLGFQKKVEVPAGAYRWLTVVSPEDPDGPELVLEPNSNPASKVYQKALFDEGIPLTMFAVDDTQREYERLVKLGVVFSLTPTKAGPATIAIFEDTCGNRIQIYQL